MRSNWVRFVIFVCPTLGRSSGAPDYIKPKFPKYGMSMVELAPTQSESITEG